MERSESHPEQRLLIEWPDDQDEPSKYWPANLDETSTRKQLFGSAKHRWIIERDYQQLKQELGLGDYEGRGWPGFHYHPSLCGAAYGFWVAKGSRFPPR